MGFKRKSVVKKGQPQGQEHSQKITEAALKAAFTYIQPIQSFYAIQSWEVCKDQNECCHTHL